ncbi:MAG: hypothetical protein IPH76_10560 [Xanthomonadales bacterium]|nr:hypothetical protein [Xanthomonadales bacterium]
MGDAEPGRNQQVRRRDPLPRAQGAAADAHIFAGAAQVLSDADIVEQTDAAGGAGQQLHLLDRHHRIGTFGNACPGHDLAGEAGFQAARAITGGLFAADRPLAAARRRSAGGVKREAVHRGVVKRW